MDKIKTVKIKNPDGSVSEETYTISVDAKDVDMANGKDLQDTIGTINIDIDGNIAEQLKKIKNYDEDIDNLNDDIDNLETNINDIQNNIIDLQSGKINKNDIVDNLNTDSSNKVLSAKQGKILGDAIQRKIYYFNTVADMKSQNLQNGDYAYTLGYHNANDGGQGQYIIKNGSYTDNGGTYHQLNNGLFAELIIDKDITVKQCGAYGDGINDDSDAIQFAIASSYNVIFNGPATYLITKPLNITRDRKVLQGRRGAVIKVDVSNFIGNEAVLMSGQNIKIENLGLSITDPEHTIDGWHITGFMCYMNNVSSTTGGRYALFVEGAEARVYNSNFKSAQIGVLVKDYDFLGENLYCENNSSTGFYANGYGSLELHHVHSYNNDRHGFYLNGTSYSNFYGCYADTNGINGFEIRDQSHSNFFGCWAYKCGQISSAYGFVLYGSCSSLNFYGCMSSSPGTYVDKSIRIGESNSTDILLHSCFADSPVELTSVPVCENCSGTLTRYNLGTKRFLGSNSIAAGETKDLSIPMVIPDSITSPGCRGFEIHYVMRNNQNTYTRSGIINFTTGGSGNTINYNGDATPGITISNISFTIENNITKINFTVSHSQSTSIRFGGTIEYLGSDRSYS